MVPIGEGTDYKFKGYIDAVVKTSKMGNIILVDWKTCSWGWDARKKLRPNGDISAYFI